MVKLYFHDNLDTPDDFTDAHDSGIPVSLDHLATIGVFYKQIDNMDDLNAIAKERNYRNRDVVKLNLEKFNNDEVAYNNLMKKFYTEHFHEDEEIRYIVNGEGYFDVRDNDEKWIRAKLDKFDLLILPAGIYHRFTLTSEKKDVEAIRLFKDEPKWEAINRTENRASLARDEYVKQISA